MLCAGLIENVDPKEDPGPEGPQEHTEGLPPSGQSSGKPSLLGSVRDVSY